jgi:DNA polymerase-3 subunit gamma/tau
LKFVPAAQDDVAFSAELRQRGQAAAEQLSTRVLSRLWQGLLSGHEEVNRAMNAKAAGEMVLIRLAHLADAPTPDELIKKFDTAAPPASSPSPSPASSSSVSSSGHSPNAQMAVSAEPQSVGTGFASGAPPRAMAQAAPVVQAHVPVLQSFQAVIDLAADKRDIGLKHALENGVHLVSFETAAADRAGRIELRLAEGQDNMAQDLTRKLRDWTGQNWVVSLSQEKGAATLGSLKRSAAEQREDAARQDPHVQAALAAFPGAEILSVNDFSDAFDAISNDDMPNDDISNDDMPIDADRDADEG